MRIMRDMARDRNEAGRRLREGYEFLKFFTQRKEVASSN
jgi:hypothetical protein